MDSGAADQSGFPGAKSAWGATLVLTLLYWFGTLDRQMSVLLVTPIKQYLKLSDVEVSLIYGMAFALFYMLASFPIGWLVDRIPRRRILFWGAVIWASAASASGLTRSFSQLFGARAIVGAGEATLHPTTFSILADLFPPGRLALPLTVFVLGSCLGSGMSFILGGTLVAWADGHAPFTLPLIGEVVGWQFAFIVTGFPGLLVAATIFLVPEPLRRRSPAAGDGGNDLGGLWRCYRSHLSFYIFHVLGFGLVMMFVIGLMAWNPAFLTRHHGWDIARIGRWVGFTQIGAALLGLTMHGWVVDWLFRKGRQDAHMIYFTVMALLACPAAVAAYLVESPYLMLALFTFAYFCVMAYPAIGPASLQIATPPELRGKISAIYMIIVNLIGTVGGPLTVAMFTDHLFRNEAELGYSMSLFAGITTLAAASFFWFGCGPMRLAIQCQHVDRLDRRDNKMADSISSASGCIDRRGDVMRSGVH